jgi:hypothetical protein
MKKYIYFICLLAFCSCQSVSPDLKFDYVNDTFTGSFVTTASVFVNITIPNPSKTEVFGFSVASDKIVIEEGKEYTFDIATSANLGAKITTYRVGDYDKVINISPLDTWVAESGKVKMKFGKLKQVFLANGKDSYTSTANTSIVIDKLVFKSGNTGKKQVMPLIVLSKTYLTF